MSDTVLEVLALIGAVLLLIAAGFQLALAAGAPLGAAAYGGRLAGPDGCLPSRYRVVSVATAVLLIAIGALLLLRGGVLDTTLRDSAVVVVAVWIAGVLFALNTAGNFAGRHPLERWGMGSLTAMLTVLSVLLAIGR